MRYSMRYVRPWSLAWWAGVALIAMGVAQAAGWPSGWDEGADGLTGVLRALAAALATLTGAGGEYTPPGLMIATGVGLIGLRDAQVRYEMRMERAATEFFDMDDDDEGDGFDDWDVPEEYPPSTVIEGPPLPPGESPLPPDVRDPYGPGGSRG